MDDRPLFAKLTEALGASVTGKPSPSKIELSPEASAWRDRGRELAQYVLKYLVNRADIYGRYNRDGEGYTAKDGLTFDKIERHFRPVTPQDIIGTHSTLAEQVQGPRGELIVSCTSRWVANDIDHHGEGPAPPENSLAAKAWHQRAADLGFRPLTVQSNGSGGYRISILFSEPIQTPIAFRFIRWLQRDWKERGLQAEPEWFPRQQQIKLADDPNDLRGACGNWLRLYGRHHKREHHSRFWDGERVLAGNDAIDWLLDHTGDDPAMIPPEALAFNVGEFVGRARESTRPERPKSFDDLSLAAEALRSLRPLAADYHGWLHVGMALRELGDSGLSLWESWSKQCLEKYQPEVCREKWETFAAASDLNGEGISLGWLFHEAEHAGWKYPKTEWVTGTAAQADPREAAVAGFTPVLERPDPPGGAAFHGQAGPKRSGKRRLIVERLSDVQEKSTEWLCPDRIPLGELVMLTGDIKLGKSLYQLYLAACVSTGASIHGQQPAQPPGNVVLLIGEDSVEKTVRVRLRAATADLDRIFIIRSALDEHNNDVIPALKTDIALIEEAATARGGVTLVGIDTISSFLAGIDDHKNVELRSVLLPLSRLADRLNCTITGVNHVAKAPALNSRHRALGSVAYGATARANFLFAPDPNDPGRMFIADSGRNLGEPVPTLAYRVVGSHVVGAPILRWETTPVDLSADQIVRAEYEASRAARHAEPVLDIAKAFLRTSLKNGPLRVDDIKTRVGNLDIRWRSIERAKKDLMVVSGRVGFGHGSYFEWSLPAP
jgi:hypothetical protein